MKLLGFLMLIVQIQADCKEGTDGACKQCSDEVTCGECNEYYYLDDPSSETACKRCHESCRTCSGPASTNCITCPKDRYISTADNGKQCIQCIQYLSNCAECLGPSACTVCNPPYYPDASGVCVLCGSLARCDFCKNQDQCLKCEYEYYPNANGVCQKAITDGKVDNCFSYDMYAGCNMCKYGYYLENAQSCKSCHLATACSMCNGEICASCYKDYYRTSLISCYPCSTIANCLDCREEGCVKCVEKYYRKSKTECAACVHPCMTCKGPDNGKCLTCHDTHYLSAPNALTGIGTCLPCGDKVSYCTHCTLNGTCTGCQTGYHLTSSHACRECDTPCAACKVGGNGECSDCISTHFLNITNVVSKTGECLVCSIKVAGCATCNVDGSCTKCSAGLCLESPSSCKALADIPYCDKFNDEDGCTNCYDGYYLKNKTKCEQCETPCTRCNTPSIVSCFDCIEGFYLDGNSPAPCVKCPPGCISCTSADCCLGCTAGYNFTEKQCVRLARGKGYTLRNVFVLVALLIFICHVHFHAVTIKIESLYYCTCLLYTSPSPRD
eukprot:TRINITY_DN4130_c0_g1_i27.p1 TRINITY_DN4130_c0_g1~~TRINITY_DN4130_c0_g1_i27.p1  ORF type:complete len:554 (-),score=45.12 TRINITY_DN4130_c0_g1_i27:77-1738(-)